MGTDLRPYIPKIKSWVDTYYFVKKLSPHTKNDTDLKVSAFWAKLAELRVSFELFGEDRVCWDISKEIGRAHV